MDKNGDKIMSVKNELDNFFERFLAAYQKTEDGLPKRPRRKDVDQAVYVGEAVTLDGVDGDHWHMEKRKLL